MGRGEEGGGEQESKTARIRVEGFPIFFLSCQYEKKVSSSPQKGKGVKGSFRDRQVHADDVFQGTCDIRALLERGSMKLNQYRKRLVRI